MDKEKRLLPEQSAEISSRMKRIALLGRIDVLTGKCTQEEHGALLQQLSEAQELIKELNGAGFVDERMKEALDALAQRAYVEEDGSVCPWLREDEYHMLSIVRGTLSKEERAVMEEHVSITGDMLQQIPFSTELSHVTQWASSHHEFLNGTGYPRHLSGEDIPYEVRMITILDIYDSLVADDRPYKPAKPKEDALRILEIMAKKEGKLDEELVGLFRESRCWDD